ncbi:MAG: hypothetical protein KatS3mg051_2147 [Anaerolineae bacterium]|nr:MAG: hypothetical protein KatS3mg051_2147 [Anaerolineae bacterium]
MAADESIWDRVRLHPWKYRRREQRIDGVVWHATRGGQMYPGYVELRAAVNWFMSPHNRVSYAGGDYAGISNYVVGPGRIVEVVPPDEYVAAWSTYPSDLHAVSVEVCQSNRGQTIEPETIASCIRLAEWLEQRYGIPRQRVFPHREGGDERWTGHAGHADTVQGRAQGKSDPDDRFWSEFSQWLEGDEMKPEERELLLKVATVLFGDSTGRDFTTVEEALARARVLAVQDAVVLQGLAETQRWLAQHTHDAAGKARWPGGPV